VRKHDPKLDDYCEMAIAIGTNFVDGVSIIPAIYDRAQRSLHHTRGASVLVVSPCAMRGWFGCDRCVLLGTWPNLLCA
jgi:hypothetical protein